MIAQELEVSLHLAFVEARQKRHEFITVEHLLLALLDNPSAAEAIRACGGHIEQLRLELLEFIARHSPTLAGDGDIDTQPTRGFGSGIGDRAANASAPAASQTRAPKNPSPR